MQYDGVGHETVSSSPFDWVGAAFEGNGAFIPLQLLPFQVVRVLGSPLAVS
jgi:hypothetical protein